MTIKNSSEDLSENLENSEAFSTMVTNITELEEIIAERKEEIKDVYLRAKTMGLNVKAMKQVVKESKNPDAVEARIEYETTLDKYREILGLWVC